MDHVQVILKTLLNIFGLPTPSCQWRAAIDSRAQWLLLLLLSFFKGYAIYVSKGCQNCIKEHSVFHFPNESVSYSELSIFELERMSKEQSRMRHL